MPGFLRSLPDFMPLLCYDDCFAWKLIIIWWALNFELWSWVLQCDYTPGTKYIGGIYTQKNIWRILKFFWLYNIWEYNFQTNYFCHWYNYHYAIHQNEKMNFTGHWLRYSTKTNVPTLSTQSSQAKNLALSNFAATFTRSLLMF